MTDIGIFLRPYIYLLGCAGCAGHALCSTSTTCLSHQISPAFCFVCGWRITLPCMPCQGSLYPVKRYCSTLEVFALTCNRVEKHAWGTMTKDRVHFHQRSTTKTFHVLCRLGYFAAVHLEHRIPMSNSVLCWSFYNPKQIFTNLNINTGMKGLTRTLSWDKHDSLWMIGMVVKKWKPWCPVAWLRSSTWRCLNLCSRKSVEYSTFKTC